MILLALPIFGLFSAFTIMITILGTLLQNGIQQYV